MLQQRCPDNVYFPEALAAPIDESRFFHSGSDVLHSRPPVAQVKTPLLKLHIYANGLFHTHPLPKTTRVHI
ncbi:hypothetical protein DPMN_097501 [Dreissena polymorpha]|uniref:Uncharacterized protein n=1 Tax=Dreissena polymorpha TaxID=45954 RepID=A0A9D4R4M1_DREPO|nr:hypothetical protein DPMN_097501 [Dreissena polymorpha]